jgi:hypothetical protein
MSPTLPRSALFNMTNLILIYFNLIFGQNNRIRRKIFANGKRFLSTTNVWTEFLINTYIMTLSDLNSDVFHHDYLAF